MKPVEPIITIDLLPDIHDKLLKLLLVISPTEWAKSTTNPKWSVKDIVAHLLWDDLYKLSRERDDFSLYVVSD